MHPDMRWAGKIGTAVAGLWVMLATACFPAMAQSVKVQDDRPENYPDGPQRESTFYFCTACHSFKLVAQQGMTREQWDDTLSWMQQKHGLPSTDGKDRNNLLDYLSTAFPQRQKSGWQNPFSK